MKTTNITRRRLLQGVGALGTLAAMDLLLPSYARGAMKPQLDQSLQNNVIDLTISETPFKVDGKLTTAITVNGTVPGPILRLREGQETTIRVTNGLKETSSLNWHGMLVPPDMDGTPGVSYPGIYAGKTFEYRFTPKQHGTYLYHAVGYHDQQGVYGPIIIDPAEPNPYSYDREYIVLLSDWSFKSPEWIMRKLKTHDGYFNFQQRTFRSFLKESRENGFSQTWDDYKRWSKMRMSPTDLSDVSGYVYTYLMNGMAAESNWTGTFRRDEKVLLRIINAASMTAFDVRIPDLTMMVVAADGDNIQPVQTDEFRMGVGEIYDVIVEPGNDRAYTIFAESADRSGFVRGTLAPRPGMNATIPKRRPRPLLTMADMGMSMQDMDMNGIQTDHNKMNHDKMQGMDMSGGKMDHGNTPKAPLSDRDGMAPMTHGKDISPIPGVTPVPSPPVDFGPGNAMVPMTTSCRIDQPGTGLGHDGWKVLVYTDLKALEPFYDQRPPSREIIFYLTGSMEPYVWSFNGKKFSEQPDISFHYGERLRLTLVNYTMMEHPIHIHGMLFNMENGRGQYLPSKHTIQVKPAERVSALVTANARGHWAFHCHLLYHMMSGMLRVIDVSDVLASSPAESHEVMSSDLHAMPSASAQHTMQMKEGTDEKH